ncbi:MAG: hypothetical protein IJY90_03380 [Clostridia bacterium]|nr:hypothetical protein [Clostridia bacterium]
MIVCKFGGSATASKKAIKNIKVLSANLDRRVLVFSAIGKINKHDEKITDLLIALTKENIDRKIIINKIKAKFNKLLLKINKKIEINKKIDNIIKCYNKNKDYNYLISRGEYLTSFIMSKYLNIPFVPAEKIIFFKKEKIDYKRIKERLNYYLNKYQQIIVPGFYGINEKNKIHLMSRGGSDVSGAIIAKTLNDCIYENWTDEDGIKEINPIFEKSNTIEKMSYVQLKKLTNLDAKIIHRDCAKILKNKNIILKVCNIFNLFSKQTIVTNKKENIFYVCYKKANNKAIIFYPKGKKKIDINNIKEEIINTYKKKGK